MTDDLRANEHGFTLVEVLVATLLMMMVFMSLYALFDMSVRVYGIGNSEVETNEQARVALERMAREIRNAECETLCLASGSDASIRFDTQIGATSQNVHYRIVDGELKRNAEDLASVGEPAPPSSALTYRYCNGNYSCSPVFDANPAMVEITLVVTDGQQSQTLNTVAGLRNYEGTP